MLLRFKIDKADFQEIIDEIEKEMAKEPDIDAILAEIDELSAVAANPERKKDPNLQSELIRRYNHIVVNIYRDILKVEGDSLWDIDKKLDPIEKALEKIEKQIIVHMDTPDEVSAFNRVRDAIFDKMAEAAAKAAGPSEIDLSLESIVKAKGLCDYIQMLEDNLGLSIDKILLLQKAMYRLDPFEIKKVLASGVCCKDVQLTHPLEYTRSDLVVSDYASNFAERKQKKGKPGTKGKVGQKRERTRKPKVRR